MSELAEAGYAGKVTFEPFGNGSYALDPVAAWRRNLAAIEPESTGLVLAFAMISRYPSGCN